MVKKLKSSNKFNTEEKSKINFDFEQQKARENNIYKKSRSTKL